MSNEEKAVEISLLQYDTICGKDYPKYASAMSMAQWKDRQLRAYLKERWGLLAGSCDSVNAVRRSVIEEMYEDLFNEKLTTNPYETAR